MQRPASVTVFGILNILFGILGLTSLGFTSVAVYAVSQNRDMMARGNLSGLLAWIVVTKVFGFLAVLCEIVSGVGLLLMRRWARTGAIAYASYDILSTFTFTIIAIVAAAMGPGIESNDRSVLATYGATPCGCAGSVYAILLLVFMSRPHVKAAFAGTWSPAEFAVVPAQDHLIQSPPATPSDNPFASPVATKELPLSATIVGSAPPQTAGDTIVETFIPSKNGEALASYYLGLFSLFPCLGFFLGVAAVYYGVRGLRKVRENPAVRGGAHAWVGLICGSIFGLFNLLLLIAGTIGLVAAAMESMK